MHADRMRQGIPWIVAGLLVPATAHADVLWPAMFVTPRMLSIPVIVIGLFLEATVLAAAADISGDRAGIMALAVNAISATLGFVAIPIAGLMWELVPGTIINFYAHTGTFNPVTWSATFVISALLTTGIEGFALRRIFHIALGQRGWWLWLAANGLSVGLVFLSFVLEPLEQHETYRLWLFW